MSQRQILFLIVLVSLIVAVLCVVGARAADFVDTIQGQDAAGCFDTRMRENDPYLRYAFGANTTLNVADTAGSGTRQRSLVWFTNIDTATVLHTGATVDSILLQLYCETQVGGTVVAYEPFKPLFTALSGGVPTVSYEGTKTGTGADTTEAGAITWEDWNSPDSSWRSGGADSANNSGAQNRTTNLTTTYPHIAVSATGFGGSSTNAYTSNNAYATTTSTTGTRLSVGFSMSIPTNAIIDSIGVTVEAHSSDRGVDNDVAISLANDALSYSDDGGTMLNGNLEGIPTTDTVVTITLPNTAGGWNAGITAAGVNSGDFRVGIRKHPTDWVGTAYVDSVSCVLYYRAYGADRTSTAMATQTVSSAATWYSWKIDPTLSAAWGAGSKQPYGALLASNTGGAANVTIFTSSEGTAAQRPRWLIYSHTASATGRRRALLMGGD